MMNVWILLALSFFLSFHASAFEVIAHRGVHQTFPREGVGNDTCTASMIYPPTHTYIENTLESIRSAFRMGAFNVEVDIHPTTELDGKPGEMVVFHDWTLDCRTEARCSSGCVCENNACVTHLQSLSFLKSLDIGYGYTFDGGKSFPFRGMKKGMPRLEEVLDLLVEFPNRKMTFDQKDRFPHTAEIFLRIAAKYPVEVRRRLYVNYNSYDPQKFKDLEIQEAIHYGDAFAKTCIKKYVLYGWLGIFPEACRNTKLMIPLHETLERVSKYLKSVKATSIIWGWPNKFIERAHSHGTKIYVSQVNSAEDLALVRQWPIDGIMTDKIEVVGPLYK